MFAYGEALGGALPEVNRRLKESGSAKQYKNMLGYTFGTSFGVGMIVDGWLNRGDNSCVETFCLKHKKYQDAARATFAEMGEVGMASYVAAGIQDVVSG